MELLNEQGTYLELLDREVIVKQKELLVDTVRGVIGAGALGGTLELSLNLHFSSQDIFVMCFKYNMTNFTSIKEN